MIGEKCLTTKRSVTAYKLEMRLKIFEGQFLSDLLILGQLSNKGGILLDDPLSQIKNFL